MATETISRLVDDISGGEATQTISYAWSGQAYEIDLNDKNAEEFAEVLAPYVSASRKVGRSTGAKAAKAPQAVGEVDVKAVRAWAAEQGIDINPRGRIKSSVLEQYRASH